MSSLPIHIAPDPLRSSASNYVAAGRAGGATRGGEVGKMPAVSLINCISYPQICYAGLSEEEIIDRALSGGIAPAGHYAFACRRNDAFYLARDDLG
jgi:hypothetical protein